MIAQDNFFIASYTGKKNRQTPVQPQCFQQSKFARVMNGTSLDNKQTRFSYSL